MMDSENGFQEEFFRKHDYYKIIILLLKKGEPVEIRLTGHCMKPFLHEGDLITVQPLRAEELSCGDVAVYHVNGRLKAHRFLRFVTVDEIRHIITKSDRRYGYDPPVSLSAFLGVITHVKKGDRVIDYETNQWKRINVLLAKTSPSVSLIERPIFFLLRLPRRCAGKLYRTGRKIGI